MKKWEIITDTKQQNDRSVDIIIEQLLTQRGITTPEEKEAFLHPVLSTVNPQTVGIDATELEKALTRIKQAFAKGEQVIVFGDYDVDGIAGTAIVWETLISLGVKAMPYIPHRMDEGYGLSDKGIDNVLQQYPETKLMITVDNGIVAGKAVQHAAKKGIDVIITDHHLPDDEHEKPEALAIVHSTKLCGASVGWLLAKELEREFGTQKTEMDDIHLELAAMATVTDLVPLTGANRTILYHGIQKLCSTRRFGLVELFARAAIDATTVGVYEIGHVIGPRLNAAGRLETAMDSLRLLCTRDRGRAHVLAGQLDTTNRERQTIMFESTQHASSVVRSNGETKKILILAQEEYQEGVIGLIAGRLVEEFYRPAIVIAKGEKVSKGSVRSVSGFNIIEFLRSQSEFFVNVGGHPMAAGFTIETEKIPAFQKRLEQLAEEYVTEDLLQRKLKIDAVVPFTMLTQEFYERLQELAPFGMGNPEPVFLSKNVTVKEKRVIGKEGKHLRLNLQQIDVGTVFEAIAFGMGERAAEIDKGSPIDVVFTLDENTWNGRTKLQLKVKDFRKQP